MEIKDLQIILDGDIDRIGYVDSHDIALYEDKVVVYPKKVREILKKYLHDILSAKQLNEWAKFICIRGEYCCPENPSDFANNEDYYEDMWNVIQCLSTPEIDGEINEECVRQYLGELEKYTDK